MKAPTDYIHPDVVKWLEDGGDIMLHASPADVSFVQAQVKKQAAGDHPRRFGEALTFEHHATVRGSKWQRVAVNLYRDDPVLDVYTTSGYGDTDNPVPVFPRDTFKLQVKGLGDVPDIITDGVGGNCLQGQGCTSAHFTIDTKLRRQGAVSAQRQTSDYVPHDGNSTGGNWAYMQHTTPLDDHPLPWWREQLYPHARYGGRWTHPDGSHVTEGDYPKAVGSFHWHRDTPTWIVYPNPREPWRSRGDMRAADDQHFSVYDALFEACEKWPHDSGFRWEAIFAVHRTLFQHPGHDKGTFSWDPGSSRARGRLLKCMAKAVRAMLAIGDRDLALMIARRLAERLNNQVAEFRGDVIAGRAPMPRFWPKGGYKVDGVQVPYPAHTTPHAAHEVGVWVWGLDHVCRLLDDLGVDYLRAEVGYMFRTLSDFCLRSFHLTDTGVDLPYVVFADGSHPHSGSGGDHFAWFAAMHGIPRDAGDEEKLTRLAANPPEARFRGGL